MKSTKQTKREATRLFRLCLVDGLVDEARVRQAVQRIVDEKRRGYLALLAHFRRLVRLDRDQHTAAVESAVPLSEDLRVTVEADLHHAYGPKLNILFGNRPALIGGMRIKIGSDVYDGSVQAGLAALERNF
jgi:F-type H+-transporting ATPase subunit delta